MTAASPVKTQQNGVSTPTSRASQSRRTRLANSPFRQRRFVAASTGGSPSAAAAAAAAASPKSATLLASPKSATSLTSPKSSTLLASPKSATLLASPKSATSLVSPKSATSLVSPKSAISATSPKSATLLASPKSAGALRAQLSPVASKSPKSTQSYPAVSQQQRAASPDVERSGGVSVRERRRMLLARQNRSSTDNIVSPVSSLEPSVSSPSSLSTRTPQDPVAQSPRTGWSNATVTVRDAKEKTRSARALAASKGKSATPQSPVVHSTSSRVATTSVNDPRRISPTGSARYQRKNRVRAAVVTSPTSPTPSSQEPKSPLSPTEDDPSISSPPSKALSPQSHGMTTGTAESSPPPSVGPTPTSPTNQKSSLAGDNDSSLFSVTTASASLVDSAGGPVSTLTDNSSRSKSQRQKSRRGNRKESGVRSPRSTDGSIQDSLAYSASVVSGSTMGGTTSSNFRDHRPHALSVGSGGRSAPSVPADDDSNTMFNSIGTGTIPSVEQEDLPNPRAGASGLSIESSSLSRDSYADQGHGHPALTPRTTPSNKGASRVPPKANESTAATKRIVPLKGGPDEAAGFPASPPPASIIQPWDPQVLKKKLEMPGHVRANEDDGSASHRSSSAGARGHAASYDSNDNSTHIMYGEGDDGSAHYGSGRGGRRRGRPGVSADRHGIRSFDPLSGATTLGDAAGPPLRSSTSYPGMTTTTTTQSHLGRVGGKHASAGGAVTDEEVSLQSGTIASLSEHGSRVGSIRGDVANGGDSLQPEPNNGPRASKEDMAMASGLEWAVNKDDLEYFRKGIDRPVVQAAVGVGAAAALGAILLGPVGLLVGAASVGIGVGVMQIPEEQRSNLADKAKATMKKVQNTAESTGESMSYACVGACEKSGFSDTIPTELNPCVPSKDAKGGGGKQMTSRRLFATGSDDSGGSMGPDKRAGDINTRGEFSMGHGDTRRHHNDARSDQQRLSHHSHGGDRRVACLRQGMITPVDQIHSLKPSQQPRAWLDVMASASTTREEKNEAMQEILILAKDKNHSRTLLEEGILDSLMWILTDFFAKYANEYQQLNDAAALAAGGGMVPLSSLREDGSVFHAQLAATCCVALGKAHCAVVHTEGDLLLMSSYSRGTVPEERQLAQMLYEVPHHMCVTTTTTTTPAEVAAGGSLGANKPMSLSMPTDGVPRVSGTAQQVTGNEVFTLTEMSMQQAEELAKSIKALADGVIVI